MSALTSRPALRWLVPAGVALAILGGGVGIGALTAAADPTLPPRSAAQLLVDLQTARLDGLSGTVVERADLGLPPLPDLGGQGSTDLTSLISGTHTLRVWYSGPDKARVALMGTLGETDVITNGKDLWTWSSKENKATHRTLPDRGSAPPTPEPTATAFTPEQLANLALAAIDPSTEVTTDGSASVAGRDAYELILSPRDTASLVGSVRLAIDAKEHVPLRVQVFARGGDSAAIEAAFTQVSFTRPDPEQFAFNPPPGAQVVEEGTAKPDGTKPEATEPAKPEAAEPDGAKPHAKTAVVGTGWTSVLVARIPKEQGKEADEFGHLLEGLPAVSGTWGSGRLLAGKLFSVLVTNDGRILAGAVAPQRLYQAAADPAAALSQ
jgi:outer membrane lipoprotein-sorting protein